MHGLRSGIYGLGYEVWGMRFEDWIEGLGLEIGFGVWCLGFGFWGVGSAV